MGHLSRHLYVIKKSLTLGGSNHQRSNITVMIMPAMVMPRQRVDSQTTFGVQRPFPPFQHCPHFEDMHVEFPKPCPTCATIQIFAHEILDTVTWTHLDLLGFIWILPIMKIVLQLNYLFNNYGASFCVQPPANNSTTTQVSEGTQAHKEELHKQTCITAYAHFVCSPLHCNITDDHCNEIIPIPDNTGTFLLPLGRPRPLPMIACG